MSPHKSNEGATEYVNKCIDISRAFNEGHTDILCIANDKEHRNSMVKIKYIKSKY